MKKFPALLLLMCFSVPAVFAHDRHENGQDITVKTQKAGGAVTMLQGRGGNVGASIGADGVLIVDDDFAPVAPKIAEALKTLAGADKPRFVLNTHWHGDHTGGNAFFGKDSLIVAHANVRRRMSVESVVRGNKVSPAPAVALPVLTYDQSMSIHFNGEEIRVIHFPNGHTDGD